MSKNAIKIRGYGYVCDDTYSIGLYMFDVVQSVSCMAGKFIYTGAYTAFG